MSHSATNLFSHIVGHERHQVQRDTSGSHLTSDGGMWVSNPSSDFVSLSLGDDESTGDGSHHGRSRLKAFDQYI
jgi:hypothetical protein